MAVTTQALLDITAIEAERQSRSLLEFIKGGWHVVEPGRPFINNWHIGAICEHLDAVDLGQIHDLVVSIPPRYMKSLAVCVFWPAQRWTRRPDLRYLCASYAGMLSMRDSRKCRQVVESSWYQARWGSKFRILSDQNAKIRWENDKLGIRISTSVGGTTTGEGGDVIIVDDPHNVLAADSEVRRMEVIEWWDTAMSTRLNDPRNGARIIVGQRVHEADLSGHVLNSGGDWVHLKLPTIYDGLQKTHTVIGFEDPRTQKGELLWPERVGDKEVARIRRENGVAAFSAQQQQDPIPLEGSIIQKDYFRYYTPDTLPDKFDIIITSWDMAFKDKATSSYVVGETWGRLGADKYLLAVYREHVGFIDTLAAVVTNAARWKPQAILVEDAANGPAIINTLKAKVSALLPIQARDSKVSRLQAVSPQFQAGNVWVPEDSEVDWVREFIAELCKAPNGEYMDQCDAASQALRWLQENELLSEEEDGDLTIGSLMKSSVWRR